MKFNIVAETHDEHGVTVVNMKVILGILLEVVAPRDMVYINDEWAVGYTADASRAIAVSPYHEVVAVSDSMLESTVFWAESLGQFGISKYSHSSIDIDEGQLKMVFYNGYDPEDDEVSSWGMSEEDILRNLDMDEFIQSIPTSESITLSEVKELLKEFLASPQAESFDLRRVWPSLKSRYVDRQLVVDNIINYAENVVKAYYSRMASQAILGFELNRKLEPPREPRVRPKKALEKRAPRKRPSVNQ